MTVVLIPDFRSQHRGRFTGDISVIGFETAGPDDKFVLLFLRQRQDAFLQFHKAHSEGIYVTSLM